MTEVNQEQSGSTNLVQFIQLVSGEIVSIIIASIYKWTLANMTCYT